MQSSDIAWQVSRCSIRRNFICKKSQCKGDNSVCHLCSHQTLLGKFLDVVSEEILYVKKSQSKGDNSVCHWYRHSWPVSRCNTRRNFICKKSQGKGDNSVCHLCSQQTLHGKSLDVVQEEI
jgi:hypothetical protein